MFIKEIIKKYFKPKAGLNNKSNREAWLEKTLAAVPAGVKILDAGAGTQRYRRFCQHLEYISQDFGEYKGEEENAGGLQRKTYDYGKLDIVSDITAIPVENGSFDAVMCVEVLEHLPDPIKAIKEFSRVLKSGGSLVLTAPFCSLTHYAPYHFSTGFNKFWYEKHLAEAGFEIIEITPNGNYFEYLAQEANRLNSVSRRYSRGLNILERIYLLPLLYLLGSLSKRDKNSAELLCFGYHILAKKKN